MKCLVLGGGGFIGSHLAEALLASGHEVAVFDHPGARYLGYLQTKGISVFTGDFLNQREASLPLSGSDVIYHLISATVPQTSNDDPAFDVEANVLGTLRMLDEARKAGVKKIIFSSSGGTVYGIPQEIPIKESHPTHPTSSYGICKLTIEKYLHLYWVLYGLDYNILRISNAYGDRQPARMTQGVISSFLDKTLRGDELIIWGDGSVIRDYIYISDIVDAMMKVANYEGDHKIFNIGAGQGHSIKDIINSLEQILQRPLQLRYMPARKFDVPVNILDISRAMQYLAWEPRVGLQDGIFRTYEWALQNMDKR
ncbi:MAG: NAD-dependent epimerase [Chloroflexi bacterium]|nr:NAD-dependent epimerase [Chloroflexota bacterium]MDL1944200.1 NAD-dependent epimerase/dehydratase family protein [Chloroflexi bacterium CFX2]